VVGPLAAITTHKQQKWGYLITYEDGDRETLTHQQLEKLMDKDDSSRDIYTGHEAPLSIERAVVGQDWPEAFDIAGAASLIDPWALGGSAEKNRGQFQSSPAPIFSPISQRSPIGHGINHQSQQLSAMGIMNTSLMSRGQETASASSSSASSNSSHDLPPGNMEASLSTQKIQLEHRMQSFMG
jgi:hypothetical protein